VHRDLGASQGLPEDLPGHVVLGGCGQVDEVDRLDGRGHALCHRDGEPGLAAATWPEEGDETLTVGCQQRGDLVDLVVATHDETRDGGETAGCSQAAQWRKRRRQARQEELVEALLPGDVLEAVPPEIDQRAALRQPILDTVGGRGAQDDLTPVRGRRDPRPTCTSMPTRLSSKCSGVPVCRPMRTRRIAPSGRGCDARSRWPCAAAATASEASVKTTKKLSPSV